MSSVHILLVEDNEGDIILTLEALSEANIKNQVTVVRDGEEALEFLNHSKATSTQLPDLILLDINLPKIDGKEVLSYIKKTSVLKRIPVVMLTTSSSPLDIADAYDNHSNCFITKPVDISRFFEIVRSIEEFWLSTVKLPTQEQ